jgi:hypothetical protein
MSSAPLTTSELILARRFIRLWQRSTLDGIAPDLSYMAVACEFPAEHLAFRRLRRALQCECPTLGEWVSWASGSSTFLEAA